MPRVFQGMLPVVDSQEESRDQLLIILKDERRRDGGNVRRWRKCVREFRRGVAFYREFSTS